MCKQTAVRLPVAGHWCISPYSMSIYHGSPLSSTGTQISSAHLVNLTAYYLGPSSQSFPACYFPDWYSQKISKANPIIIWSIFSFLQTTDKKDRRMLLTSNPLEVRYYSIFLGREDPHCLQFSLRAN